MWENIKGFFKHNIAPFFMTFAEHEVVALQPIAAQAINNLEEGEIAALAAGGKDTGHVLAKVVRDTAAAAETAGIAAGAGSLLVAVGNAAATHTAMPAASAPPAG